MSGHDMTASGFLHVDAESKAPYAADVLATLADEAAVVIARYPQKRSALLPLLHLVQSVDGYVTGRGVTFCAEQLDLTEAEVSGVATFYTQYKRHPNGEYTVGVCTNTLCAVMGGDQIFERVSEHLGVGHDETTEDGKVTLERIECNAACDYAPVVMANWEFFDNQTPESTMALVDDLRAGATAKPTRGADSVVSFKAMSRVLAGFNDGRGGEGVGAGPASLLGLRIAKERDWVAPGERHRDGSVAGEPTSDTTEGPTESVTESAAEPATQTSSQASTPPDAAPAAAPDGAPAGAEDAGPTAAEETGAAGPSREAGRSDSEPATKPVDEPIDESVDQPSAPAAEADEAEAATTSRDSLITGMPAWNPDAAPAADAPGYADPHEADEADERTVRRADLQADPPVDHQETDEADAATVRRSSLKPEPLPGLGASSDDRPDSDHGGADGKDAR
nr:NADH-quinone oxidoreductase subunit NuoE [Humibacillus sp. DSM 29435]